MRRALAALALLPAPAGAAQGKAPAPNGESWDLYRSVFERRAFDILVPTGPCEVAAERLASVLRTGGFDVTTGPDQRDPAAIRYRAGTPRDTELAALAWSFLDPLPDGFRVLGREYRAAGDAVVAVFEDPAQRGRPLYLALGNDPEVLAAYLDDIPRLSQPHLWVHADGEIALECPLELDGRPRKSEARDYLAERQRHFAEERALTLENFVVRAKVDPVLTQWGMYRRELVGVRKKVMQWFHATEVPEIELLLYEHIEDFERCLGTSALSVTNRLHPRVHVLLAPGMPDDAGAGLARVLARSIAGPPAQSWMEDGLAVAAAGRWWQRSLDEWIARLATGRLLPPADDVTAMDGWSRWSEHALLPARALLFERSAFGERKGAGNVRAFWKGANVAGIAMRYQRGITELMQSAEPRKKAKGALRRRRAAPAAPLEFLHGIALVDGEDASYSARAAGAALDAVHALGQGPDAVSLTVFATATDPAPRVCAWTGRAAYGSATDLGLANATAAARERGMGVLLALEVLAQPSGAWADNVSWTDPKDIDVFWSAYGRVARHYALLCELLGIEAFSFGSNLREVSRTEIDNPRDPQKVADRRKGWKKLINELRGAYGGRLTYTARLPSEVLEAGFFEDLDYVGLALFPRVVSKEHVPDDRELRGGLRYELGRAIDIAVRWNKPLLLVQLGYPARADSWTRPMVPSGAVDPVAQQRFHSALVDVMRAKMPNFELLRGFFLWNWPIDERRAGPTDGGFGLRGKPAESALPGLFAR